VSISNKLHIKSFMQSLLTRLKQPNLPFKKRSYPSLGSLRALRDTLPSTKPSSPIGQTLPSSASPLSSGPSTLSSSQTARLSLGAATWSLRTRQGSYLPASGSQSAACYPLPRASRSHRRSCKLLARRLAGLSCLKVTIVSKPRLMN
jgi:hypothetical protein